MPKRIGLRQSDWPPVDRSAWERANAPADAFDDQAGAAHWRPETRYQAQVAYGRWLAFARATYPEAWSEPPGARLTEVRARGYVEALRARIAPMSVAAELQHLLLAMSVLAPDSDWAWLRQWQYRCQKDARPREKRSKIVHPNRLIELGRLLMDGADDEPRLMLKARRYRDGLLIAFLATRPLRRRSIGALELDRNIRSVGSAYVVYIDAEDMKSGQSIEFELPGWLTPYMKRYLEHYRLLFPAAARARSLWLSSKGGPLVDEAIHALVCRRTKAALGFAIHPHLFRDIAATAIARDSPEQIGVARDLLAQSKVETTLRHYTQAQTVDAARKHARIIEALRGPSTARRDRSNKTRSTPNRDA
jgi:integrase/recombinase XerD